jgi:hypothetical protein
VSLFLSLGVLGACGSRTARVVIVNKAREPIARLLVTVCQQTIEARDVQPGQQASGTFLVNCEGDYNVTVEFASGKQLQTTTGYVTSGLDISHELDVTDVQMERSTVR